MSFKKTLLSSSRQVKKIIILITDFISISIGIFFALNISEVELKSLSYLELITISWYPLVSLLFFWKFGVYNSVLRYINLTGLFNLYKAVIIFVLISLIGRLIYEHILHYFFDGNFVSLISFEGWLVGVLTFSFLIFLSRIVANYYLSDVLSENKVVIYGAGSAGIQLASALRVSKEMQPIAFIDIDETLHDTYLMGLKVLPPKKLENLVQRKKVNEVLLAMPSAPKAILVGLLKEIEELSVRVRILPGLAELAQGKVSVSELKEVDYSDLLGREPVEPDTSLIKKNIENKVVLITGAGGSIGSEISRQVVKNKPKSIILIDSNEYALYKIRHEVNNLFPEIETFSILANVTNKIKVYEVCKLFNVQTIYHAAAYKHVSIVEENPFEAVNNNILGTKACVEAAIQSNVETFVLISTDKAVRPANIMGATKRFAELILQSLANKTKTSLSMVRFGNVIGSSGSAIPLFQKQIKEGGPVTVTHPDVIRYFMSIPEAAELVIQAGAMGTGGDVFVLDMGEPVKIAELAKRLINLSGMELTSDTSPNGDIEIIFTGLKPGEKLYEELLIGNDVSKTTHPRILRAKEKYLAEDELKKYLVKLSVAQELQDVKALKDIFQETVSGFQSKDTIVDPIYNHKKLTS